MEAKSPLPKSIKATFQNLGQKTEKQSLRFSNHIIYSATHIEDSLPHTILLFNNNSEIYETDRDLALSLYLQELFYLCARFGAFLGRNLPSYTKDDENAKKDRSFATRSVLDFENLAVEGDKIAFVIKGAYSLKDLVIKGQEGPKNVVDIPKMIEDVYSSVRYINARFGVSHINISPENVYAIMSEDSRNGKGKSSAEYWISNWMSAGENDIQKVKRISEMQTDGNDSRKKYAAPEILSDSSLKQDTAAEIYGLGLISLELLGIESKAWKVLPTVEDAGMYEVVLNKIIQDLASILKQQQEQSKVVNPSQGKELISLITATLKRDTSERIEEFAKFLASRETKRKLENQLGEEKEEEEKKDEYRVNIEGVKTPLALARDSKELIQEVRVLLNRPNPENIKEILLDQKSLSTNDFIVLSENYAWRNLELFSVHKSEIGDRGAVMIASNTTWKNLKILFLLYTAIGDEGGAAIGRNTAWINLEELSLDQNEIGDKGALVIGINTSWKNLKHFSMENNKIGDEGAAAIGRNTTWRNLEVLSLDQNEIGDKGAVVIASNASWKHLKKLALGNNKIGDEGVAAIGKNTIWSKLEELWLYRNEISDKGAMVIASNTTWNNLQQLSLSNNKIQDQGALAVAKNTTWQQLESLNLQGNQITETSKQAFLSSPIFANITLL